MDLFTTVLARLRRTPPNLRRATSSQSKVMVDVKLCLEEAQALGVPMWVASAVQQLWLVAERELGPESDFTPPGSSAWSGGRGWKWKN